MTKIAITLCCLTAIAAGFLPSSIVSRVRTVTRDLFAPGVNVAGNLRHAAARQLRNRFVTDDEHTLTERVTNLQSEVSQLQVRLRREQLAHQKIREAKLLALRRHDSERKPVASPPLIVPQVVEAHVIGEELSSAWRTGRLLDAGRVQGIPESALVLESASALLDQGEDMGLVPDLPVFAGSCVVGKIQHVGRWSSTWVPITDKRFRGRARLARVTTNGLEFGADGVLTGTGQQSCRLTFIKSTEPVSEGDEVYALETPGGFETPLFYGTVTRALLTAGETQWQIEVRPAAELRSLRDVCVVRPQFNLSRLAN